MLNTILLLAVAWHGSFLTLATGIVTYKTVLSCLILCESDNPFCRFGCLFMEESGGCVCKAFFMHSKPINCVSNFLYTINITCAIEGFMNHLFFQQETSLCHFLLFYLLRSKKCISRQKCSKIRTGVYHLAFLQFMT